MFTEWYYNKRSGDLNEVLESFIESNKSKEVLTGFVPNPVAGFLFHDIYSVNDETPLLYDPYQHELNYENEIAWTTQPYPIIKWENLNIIYGLFYMNEIHIFGEHNKSTTLPVELKGTFIRRVLKYQCLENTLFAVSYRIDEEKIGITSYIPDNVDGILSCLNLPEEEKKATVLHILEKTENVVRMMEMGY